MEFSAGTTLLAEAPDEGPEALEKKTTISILSHVLVEASPNGLRLAATDLEMGIRTFCPAQVKAPGSYEGGDKPRPYTEAGGLTRIIGEAENPRSRLGGIVTTRAAARGGTARAGHRARR